ncbi:class I SAM-dependent DNA methyltransferase [Vibrio sp. V39_P1S14PM300]|uniref:class I SAM-dependent DNA methyltransferase n=1 Tax=Vibrio sp. V39_P1S14PM300 TaxID=1938690 RepID=UPI0013726E3E|nr:methyltransferase domain-containing protein [Vibrio sp. V39_P1S14PM300]NAX22256.1 methyltransferase domain-containing protein [Vibrio sp. V39_P1S14PM300]
MAHDWDAYAAEWENNPATAVYAEKAFESLQQLVDLKGKHILDFGCGTGLLTQKMSPLAKDIVALDVSEAMIEQLDSKELANVEPVVDMLTRGLVALHPAFRGQFDLVVASSVCGFLPNYSDVADIVYSILDEGGLFIHWDWLVENDQDGLTVSRVKTVLSSVGFEDVSVSVPFELQTQEGTLKVLMGVGRK